MLYWFDTEFIEDGKTIDLISIGIVCEDGRELYKQNQECEFEKADDWVTRNVLLHLVEFDISTRSPEGAWGSLSSYKESTGGWWRESGIWKTRSEIADEIKVFCDPEQNGKPEFWAYYADYDWVVFCQLFGRMIDLPKGFPMYCRDIKQWSDQIGDDLRLPEQGQGEHHALADAKWNRVAWTYLAGIVHPEERVRLLSKEG